MLESDSVPTVEILLFDELLPAPWSLIPLVLEPLRSYRYDRYDVGPR